MRLDHHPNGYGHVHRSNVCSVYVQLSPSYEACTGFDMLNVKAMSARYRFMTVKPEYGVVEPTDNSRTLSWYCRTIYEIFFLVSLLFHCRTNALRTLYEHQQKPLRSDRWCHVHSQVFASHMSREIKALLFFRGRRRVPETNRCLRHFHKVL